MNNTEKAPREVWIIDGEALLGRCAERFLGMDPRTSASMVVSTSQESTMIGAVHYVRADLVPSAPSVGEREFRELNPVLHSFAEGRISTAKARELIREWMHGKPFSPFPQPTYPETPDPPVSERERRLAEAVIYVLDSAKAMPDWPDAEERLDAVVAEARAILASPEPAEPVRRRKEIKQFLVRVKIWFEKARYWSTWP